MKKVLEELIWIVRIAVGSAMFSLGFNLFLSPHGLNAGGVSGLAVIFVHVTRLGSVGVITAVLNAVLFVMGGLKIGKRFLLGSLVGAAAVSVTLDLFALLPVPETEPLLAALYGGIVCGLGLGVVFATGASTGGSDIIVRLLKRKWQGLPIGVINTIFDACVVVLSGIAYGDITVALYSGVAIYIAGKVIDMVVYSFDNSKVAVIISDEYEAIANVIQVQLERGVTYLEGQGAYSNRSKTVILSAVKKYQLTELKQLVAGIDPDAFVIVQDAHQVLGDGFSRYSKDSL